MNYCLMNATLSFLQAAVFTPEQAPTIKMPHAAGQATAANGDADVMVSTANSIALFEALPNAKRGIFQYADAFVDQALRFLAEKSCRSEPSSRRESQKSPPARAAGIARSTPQ